MKKSEVKYGAVLSYILILFSSVYGLVIMPYVLGTIGESEYGVYKTIGSITATLSVMEFGLGGTMQRFLAKYRAQKEEEKAYNYSAMCMIQAIVLAVAMLLVGGVLYFSLDKAYGSTFTPHELLRAKQIYTVLVVYVALHLLENVFNGIIAGYGKFIFSNSVKIISLFVKIILYFVILPQFPNALAIVFLSLALEVIVIIAEFIYSKTVLHHRIKLYSWDGNVFKESFVYTLLLFIQSLIIQLNGNIDNVVIGAVIGTSAVTVYSFAIQIYNMYEQCATSVSSVILPSVTNLIYNGATHTELENIIVKYGRVQWAVLGAALSGFICFGKEFFMLWLGNGFEDCYYLGLILMIPVTFPLIVNTCLAILKAKNMLRFRTVAMAYSALLNLVLTVIGTRIWGYWAAAIGTALSTVIGSVISLNIYYNIKLKINMLRVYLMIFHKITLCAAIPCMLFLFVIPDITDGWMGFLVNAVLFVAIYLVLLFVYGMNQNEKAMLVGKARK